MSAYVNDRDNIITGAQVRKVVGPSNSLLLVPSANSFYVTQAGAHNPDVITVKVVPVLVDGPFTFTAQGATLSNITATSADVAYSAVTGTTAVITVNAANAGAPVSQSCLLGVVKDGTSGTGTKGDPGSRGPGTYYAFGTQWSDVVANSAVPASTPILNDVVSISNGSSYAMWKRWDGDSWEPLGGVFDGSLFVTGSINGAALKAGTVEIRDTQGRLLFGVGDFDATKGGVLGAVNAAAGTANYSSVAGRPEDTQNLILKGTFEDGSPGGWSTAIVAVTGQSFTKAIQYGSRDLNEGGNIFPMSPGETFYVEGWLDASTANFDLALGIAAQKADGTNNWFPAAILTKGAGWTRVSGSIVVPPGYIKGQPWIQMGAFPPSNFGTARAAGLRISRFQSGATAGATLGVNVGGQITSANSSTYIASAAINLAHINTATIGSLSAVSAVIGTFKTSTTGPRSEISDGGVKVVSTSGATIRIGSSAL